VEGRKSDQISITTGAFVRAQLVTEMDEKGALGGKKHGATSRLLGQIIRCPHLVSHGNLNLSSSAMSSELTNARPDTVVVFSDLSVALEGTFRLKFVLFYVSGYVDFFPFFPAMLAK